MLKLGHLCFMIERQQGQLMKQNQKPVNVELMRLSLLPPTEKVETTGALPVLGKLQLRQSNIKESKNEKIYLFLNIIWNRHIQRSSSLTIFAMDRTKHR